MLPYNESSINDPDTMVDIHILVVPSSQWKTGLRNAHLNTCSSSISAGFVRVYPDISLADLKTEISRQLDGSLLPEKYTLLRNVGHRLTQVSLKQEAVLKVRLFLPPLAPCPEIYVLDSNSLQTTTELPPVKNVKQESLTDREGCSGCVGNCMPSPYHHFPARISHPHPAIIWEACHHANSRPMRTAALCSFPSTICSNSDFSDTYSFKNHHTRRSYPDHSKSTKNSTPPCNVDFNGAPVNTRLTTKTYPGGYAQQSSLLLAAEKDYSGKTTPLSHEEATLGSREHNPFERDPLSMGYARERLETDPSRNRYEQNGAKFPLFAQQPTSYTLHPSFHYDGFTRGFVSPQDHSNTIQQLSPLQTKHAREHPTTNTGPSRNVSIQKQIEVMNGDSAEHVGKYASRGGKVLSPSLLVSHAPSADTSDLPPRSVIPGSHSFPYNQSLSGTEGTVSTANPPLHSDAPLEERSNSSNELEQSNYSTDAAFHESSTQGFNSQQRNFPVSIRHKAQYDHFENRTAPDKSHLAHTNEKKSLESVRVSVDGESHLPSKQRETRPSKEQRATRASADGERQSQRADNYKSSNEQRITRASVDGERQSQRADNYKSSNEQRATRASVDGERQSQRANNYKSSKEQRATRASVDGERQSQRANNYKSSKEQRATRASVDGERQSQGADNYESSNEQRATRASVDGERQSQRANNYESSKEQRITRASVDGERQSQRADNYKSSKEQRITRASVDGERQLPSKQKGGRSSKKQKADGHVVWRKEKRPGLAIVKQVQTSPSSEPGVPTGSKQKEQKSTFPPSSKVRQLQVTAKEADTGVTPRKTRRIFTRESKSELSRNGEKPIKTSRQNNLNPAAFASVPALPPITATEHPVSDTGGVDILSETNEGQAKAAPASSELSHRATRPSTADTNQLLTEIRRMKEECNELTILKGELSSSLRSAQQTARTHRETNDNEWKKLFFQEKKTSTLLEEKVQKKRTIFQKLENDSRILDKGAVQPAHYYAQFEPPSESSNVKIQCRRYRRDIEQLRSRLDAVRLRVSAERKTRNAAVNECKILREELLKKKISYFRRKTKQQQVEVTT